MNSRQLAIMRLEMLALTEYVMINPNCISCSTIWSSVSKPQGGNILQQYHPLSLGAADINRSHPPLVFHSILKL
ncbi:MAG: hypothetical protein M3044_06345 [Thermoproteota archaeon]|nr:hypothetical protein [Thermoproteota archaeon]